MACASDEPMRLIDACKDLDSHDIVSFKYLCQDDIGLNNLENCIEVTDILDLLSHKESLLHYVGHRLHLMEKPCLIKGLGLELGAIKMAVEGNNRSTITPYRKALFNIAQDLGSKDVTSMIKKAKDCLQNFTPAVRKIEKNGNSGKIFNFFNVLEEKDHLSSRNISFLYQLLFDINRDDLVKFLEPSNDFNLNDFYPVNQMHRGKCLIINNVNFENNLLDRKGSNFDADELSKTFQQLNYQILTCGDLRAEQIHDHVDTVSKLDHSDGSSLVVCILSHGSLRTVFGVDGVPIQLRDLTEKFTASNCKSLAGKPKLFFIQACQGKKEQILPHHRKQKFSRESELPGTSQVESARNDIIVMDTDENETVEDVIPEESDFLLAFSTAPGWSSYRDPDKGSYYIQKLCEQIQKECMRHHMLDILTDVNNRISKCDIPIKDGQTVKTVPSHFSSLTRKLYFFPEDIR